MYIDIIRYYLVQYQFALTDIDILEYYIHIQYHIVSIDIIIILVDVFRCGRIFTNSNFRNKVKNIKQENDQIKSKSSLLVFKYVTDMGLFLQI